jgi:hypothetical protein
MVKFSLTQAVEEVGESKPTLPKAIGTRSLSVGASYARRAALIGSKADAGQLVLAVMKPVGQYLIIASAILIPDVTYAVPKGYERAYDAAMEAHETCMTAWTKKTRERALMTISDRGGFMATTLSPIGWDGIKQMAMLDKVTAALGECTQKTYPD